MKRSTLILVAVAAAVGAFVYFREYRRPPANEKPVAAKTAFHFAEADVAGLTIARAGSSVAAERQGGQWQITAPVRTRAEQGAIGDIVDDLVDAPISRTLPAGQGRLHAFGLDQPAVTLEIRLKNGQQHRVRLGNLDFSGQEVYAQMDGANDAVLLPAELRARADKSLDQLRDRSVLGFSTWEVNGFELKDPSGDFELAKQASGWKIEKPQALAADASAVESLLGQVSGARLTSVASETANDLGRYGLEHPALSFEIRLAPGGARALLLGKKSGEEYYARDTARSMIFLVPASLYKNLDLTLFDLRDKKVLPESFDQFSRIEIRNRNGRMALATDLNGGWRVQEPPALKNKVADGWRILDPLTNAAAEDILDSPPASLAALFARPAVEIELTDKSGKKEKIALSPPSGESAYLRVGKGPALYRVGKKTLESLEFKPSDIVH
jgi:Domain of unknown function (DUF4340)